jgi:predicted dehydrogenase
MAVAAWTLAPLQASEPAGEGPPLTISVACVGAGWVTRERHLPALRTDSRAQVVGVIDTHTDRAAALAQAKGLPHWGSSLDETWLEHVDAITVGAPPLEHAGVVTAALERELHCLCEKPLAIPAGDAALLAKAAERAARVLAVVHNFQFSRAGTRLFELVEGGRLGAVSAVYGLQLSNPRRRLPTWYRALPGGLFLDEAPHLLYLMRRLLGQLELRNVDGRLAGTEIEYLSATFEHASIWASLSMNFAASVSEWQLVVVAERGVAALDVFRDVLVVVPNDGTHQARDVLRSSARMLGGHVAGVASSGARLASRRLLYGNDEVVGRFIDGIEGRADRLRWIGAEDGVAVVECMEAITGALGIETLPPAG